MKRILKSLAKLYPAAWRRRYGAEYEALLEDRAPRTRDAFDVLRGAAITHMMARSFARIVLPCALMGAGAAVALSFRMPALYTSGTVIDCVGYDLVDSTGRTPYGAATDDGSERRRLDYLARNVFFDREDMAHIIQKYGLYPRERAKMPLDDVIRKMQSAILVQPVSPMFSAEELREDRIRTDKMQLMEDANHVFHLGTQHVSAFTVQFQYPDPHLAQQVDSELVFRLTGANLRFREQLASEGRLTDRAETFRMLDEPNLPQAPDNPKQIQFARIGLLGGAVGGLLLAIGMRELSKTIAAG